MLAPLEMTMRTQWCSWTWDASPGTQWFRSHLSVLGQLKNAQGSLRTFWMWDASHGATWIWFHMWDDSHGATRIRFRRQSPPHRCQRRRPRTRRDYSLFIFIFFSEEIIHFGSLIRERRDLDTLSSFGADSEREGILLEKGDMSYKWEGFIKCVHWYKYKYTMDPILKHNNF